MSHKLNFFSRALRDHIAQGSKRILIMLSFLLIIQYWHDVKMSYSKQKLFAPIINVRPAKLPASFIKTPLTNLLWMWVVQNEFVTFKGILYVYLLFLFPGHKQSKIKTQKEKHMPFRSIKWLCFICASFFTLWWMSPSGPWGVCIVGVFLWSKATDEVA